MSKYAFIATILLVFLALSRAAPADLEGDIKSDDADLNNHDDENETTDYVMMDITVNDIEDVQNDEGNNDTADDENDRASGESSDENRDQTTKCNKKPMKNLNMSDSSSSSDSEGSDESPESDMAPNQSQFEPSADEKDSKPEPKDCIDGKNCNGESTAIVEVDTPEVFR